MRSMACNGLQTLAKFLLEKDCIVFILDIPDGRPAVVHGAKRVIWHYNVAAI